MVKNKKKLLVKFAKDYLKENEKEKILKTINSFNLDYSEKIDSDSYDAIINFGGDGTVLSSVHIAILKNVPLLCFSRNSSLGFLTPFRINKFEEVLTLFTENKLKRHKVDLLGLKIEDDFYLSLNEFTIERGDPSRTITLEINVSSYSSFKVSGDGIVICSSSGSTAYNLSSGGAIIIPDTNVYQITPIACHNPYVGSIVIGGEKITNITVSNSKGYPLKVYNDGQLIKNIIMGDTLSFKMTNKSVFFFVKHKIDFIKVLNKKMFFGGRLNNA